MTVQSLSSGPGPQYIPYRNKLLWITASGDVQLLRIAMSQLVRVGPIYTAHAVIMTESLTLQALMSTSNFDSELSRADFKTSQGVTAKTFWRCRHRWSVTVTELRLLSLNLHRWFRELLITTVWLDWSQNFEHSNWNECDSGNRVTSDRVTVRSVLTPLSEGGLSVRFRPMTNFYSVAHRLLRFLWKASWRQYLLQSAAFK